MPTPPDHDADLHAARAVLQTEAEALLTLRDSLDGALGEAVDLVVGARGMVVVTGVGKSGHVGTKIAATLASTGTPAFFVHPTEASHGDLGMIGPGAVVIAISNSGETRELRDVILHTRREDIRLIAITAKPESFLGRSADVRLLLPDVPEACPNRLAPTSSTTMTIALGDALAVAVMGRQGFSREEFGARHPGGALGMSLQRVSEYLSVADQHNPVVPKEAPLPEVLRAITDGRLGAVAVTGTDGRLAGIVTDGDIRRTLMRGVDVTGLTAAEVMGSRPVTVGPADRMGVAVEIFQTRAIGQLLVAEDDRPLGVISAKDLARLGYF